MKKYPLLQKVFEDYKKKRIIAEDEEVFNMLKYSCGIKEKVSFRVWHNKKKCYERWWFFI